jgi:hypothetical protein
VGFRGHQSVEEDQARVYVALLLEPSNLNFGNIFADPLAGMESRFEMSPRLLRRMIHLRICEVSARASSRNPLPVSAQIPSRLDTTSISAASANTHLACQRKPERLWPHTLELRFLGVNSRNLFLQIDQKRLDLVSGDECQKRTGVIHISRVPSRNQDFLLTILGMLTYVGAAFIKSGRGTGPVTPRQPPGYLRSRGFRGPGANSSFAQVKKR